MRLHKKDYFNELFINLSRFMLARWPWPCGLGLVDLALWTWPCGLGQQGLTSLPGPMRNNSATLWPLPHPGRRDDVRDQVGGHTVAGLPGNYWGTPSRPRNRRVRQDGALRRREGGVPRKFRREGWSPIFCACASTQKSRGCYGRRYSAWGGPRVAGMTTIEKEEKTGVKWQAGVHVCTGCSNPRHPVRWLRS